MRREFLQLADTYNSAKHKIAGWYVSEKLDGTRCFWDGGISRGISTYEIPWSGSIDPKTGQQKSKLKPIATGLWSRYGNPIMAPSWFLDALPLCPLDGELWAGCGNFQLCRSICAGDEPDSRFNQIKYAVYSSPSIFSVFSSGEIKNANMLCNFDFETIERWIKLHARRGFCCLDSSGIFIDELEFLSNILGSKNKYAFVHKQIELPQNEKVACETLNDLLQKVLDKGGEGCVIRNPLAIWTPKRHKGILKYKPFNDAEATITGFTSGRETDKGSRLLGKIGALIVNYQGKRLELSGMTDTEREFGDLRACQWAVSNPGVDTPDWVEGKQFHVGQIVTFKYRELTDDGIPKEGRYWRHRDTE